MGEIAGGILLAVAVIAVGTSIMESATGCFVVAVVVLGLVGLILYAIWGWTPIGFIGVYAAVTALVAWHEQRTFRTHRQ